LFNEASDELFQGTNINLAKEKAKSIAAIMEAKTSAMHNKIV